MLKMTCFSFYATEAKEHNMTKTNVADAKQYTRERIVKFNLIASNKNRFTLVNFSIY